MGCLLKKPVKLLMTLAWFALLGYAVYFLLLTPDAGRPRAYWYMLEHGNINFNSDLLSFLLGYDRTMDQLEADLFSLKSQVWMTPKGSLERKEAEQELNDEISHRKHVDCIFEEMGKSYFGDKEGYRKIMEARDLSKPFVDDRKCYRDLINAYQTLCGPMTPYTSHFGMALATICNAGFQPPQFTEVASQENGVSAEETTEIVETLAWFAMLGYLVYFFFLSPDAGRPRAYWYMLEHGNINFRSDFMSFLLGYDRPMDQMEADLFSLKSQVLKKPYGSLERKEAQQKLDNELSHRRHVDCIFEEFGKSYFGSKNGNKKIKEVRVPLVDDWQCFYDMSTVYRTLCGPLSPYTLQYTMAFANICNAGFQPPHFTEVASQVCHSKCKV